MPVVSLEALLQDSSRSKEISVWFILRDNGISPPRTRLQAEGILEKSEDGRFLIKSRVFAALLKEEEPEEVLYQGIMEALGYSENRGPFLELSYKVPYRVLKRRALARPQGDKSNQIQ